MSVSDKKVFSDDLGDVLKDYGIITEKQLAEVLEEQSIQGGSVCELLIAKEFATQRQILGCYGVKSGIVPIDLEKVDIEPEFMVLIPEKVSVAFRAVPIARATKYLTVAIADPLNVFELDDIALITGLKVIPVIANEEDIKNKISDYYHHADNFEEIIADLEAEDISEAVVDMEELNIDKMREETDSAPVIKLVNVILTQAIDERASDIHIEPFAKSTTIRYRIDGILYERPSPPHSLFRAIVSRIKVISQLDIAERRLPQDGRFRIKTRGREIDFRVSILPTVHGEKVVMRVLDKSAQNMNIEKIGLDKIGLKKFKSAIYEPHGMVFVTGPTGSGKTTTLYAALNDLNKPTTNIVTVEDPVEYQFPGINQVAINPDIKLTFARGLRSILRQDPDIVLVGEVRDFETADIAVKAALTGHLVLTTLHTNDAPSAFSRIIDMGVESFLVASAVRLVVAQRLLRRLCDRCKEEIQIGQDTYAEIQYKYDPENPPVFYEPKGCQYCRKTGYHGRIAVMEVLPVTSAIKELILTHASATKLKEKALEEGMKTLRMCGLSRAAEGMTSLDEVLRVTSPD